MSDFSSDVVKAVGNALWELTDALETSDGSEVDSIADDLIDALKSAGWVIVRAPAHIYRRKDGQLCLNDLLCAQRECRLCL